MRAYYTQAGTSEPTVYAHYLYGSDGNRVKKVVRKSTGNEEVTVYIDGGFEYLYERDGSSRDEEMNEIHMMDGRSRIARVQVYGSTYGGSTSDPVLFNLEDHLGHSSFTLDDSGGAWSQEEYFPFGESSFGSYAKKRYRFCGKERDSESGLYYYGARYYAPWSCRFVSVDPLAREYPFYSPFQYAGNEPIVGIDLDGLENPDAKSSVADGNQSPKNLGYEWASGKGSDDPIKQANPVFYSTCLWDIDKYKPEYFFSRYDNSFVLAYGYYLKYSSDATAKELSLDDFSNSFERFNIPNENAFRHTLGSAMLTKHLGYEFAKDVADNHEAGLWDILEKMPEEANLARQGYEVLVPMELVDSFVDQLNNARGRDIGSNTKGNDTDVELSVLENFKKGNLFVFEKGPTVDGITYSIVRPSTLTDEKYSDALTKILINGTYGD